MEVFIFNFNSKIMQASLDVNFGSVCVCLLKKIKDLRKQPFFCNRAAVWYTCYGYSQQKFSTQLHILTQFVVEINFIFHYTDVLCFV